MRRDLAFPEKGTGAYGLRDEHRTIPLRRSRTVSFKAQKGPLLTVRQRICKHVRVLIVFKQ